MSLGPFYHGRYAFLRRMAYVSFLFRVPCLGVVVLAHPDRLRNWGNLPPGSVLTFNDNGTPAGVDKLEHMLSY